MSEQMQELGVEFEAESGRLRLTPALMAQAATAFAEGSELPQELVEAGALSEGVLVEPLPLALRAVVEPEAQLQVRVAGPGGAVLHQGWLRPDGSAVMLQVNDELGDLITLPAEFIPGTLYHAVNLGPVPRLTPGKVETTPDLLESLLDADPQVRERAIEELVNEAPVEWHDWAGGFTEDSWCVWSARMAWLDEDGEPRVHNVAAVANLEGILSVSGTEDGKLEFVPTTPTEVWSMFVLLLATD